MSSPIPSGHFDILIRNGNVVDGTSAIAPLLRLDIGIRAGNIESIGDLSAASATETIDATNKIVAPGFIDIHTHSDISLGYNPAQASSISMGVTTQIVGNCGLSIGFAIDSDQFSFEKRWLAPHRGKISWKNFAEHLDQIEERGSGNNIVPLAGHGTLRKRVMGMEDRVPNADDMREMQLLLEGALDAVVWGLSSGLEYPPSSYATECELAELCKLVAERNGIYATHLRNEGDTLVEAVQEALNVAAKAGIPLQLSHHKAEGDENWGKVKTTLQMVDAARANGMDVQTDQYPYTAFMTSLAVQTLPRHALTGTQEEVTARLLHPDSRSAIRSEMLAAHPMWNNTGDNSPWRNFQIGTCRYRPEIQGKLIADLAASANLHPIDYVLDLLSESTGFVSAVNFAICEPDIATVMQYPWTSIGSDGSGTDPTSVSSKDRIHPRTFGTFTRVLARYVRDLGVLSLSDAIYRMTGLPAARLGLVNRGRISPSYFADITIFDPEAVQDIASFETPQLYSQGIQTVLVNGKFALRDGQLTGDLHGSLLRKGR